jgi:hypothetical protein
MIGSTIKRLIALAMLATAVGLCGCAESNTAAVTAGCDGQEREVCEARDKARQVRDVSDYQNEPALGYLQSPPGLLPIPLPRNTSAN